MKNKKVERDRSSLPIAVTDTEELSKFLGEILWGVPAHDSEYMCRPRVYLNEIKLLRPNTSFYPDLSHGHTSILILQPVGHHRRRRMVACCMSLICGCKQSKSGQDAHSQESEYTVRF